MLEVWCLDRNSSREGETVNPHLKNLLHLSLIILAVFVIVIGLFICSTLKSHEQFMVGIVIVAVGGILVGLVNDFTKGVES
jgi:hypothetical protein